MTPGDALKRLWFRKRAGREQDARSREKALAVERVGTAESFYLSPQFADDAVWSYKHFPTERLDPGVVRILRIFKEAGIETCQCCEGPDGMMPEGRHGEGHCYRYPTIDILSEPWKALDLANAYDCQIDTISEVFEVRDGRPVEHFWRVEFNPRRLAEFRRSWYGREMVPDAL